MHITIFIFILYVNKLLQILSACVCVCVCVDMKMSFPFCFPFIFNFFVYIVLTINMCFIVIKKSVSFPLSTQIAKLVLALCRNERIHVIGIRLR